MLLVWGPAASGSVTVKAVRPGRDVTIAEPPKPSAMARTMARPNPAEGVAEWVRALSALLKRSKTWGRVEVGMPGPLSATSMTARSPCRRTVVRTTVPGGVWVRALLRRLTIT